MPPAAGGPEGQLPSPSAAPAEEKEAKAAGAGSFEGLDALHSRILLTLLRGDPVEAALKSAHLMPSVVADTINEALFDEIGDNVLECDGDTITLVEDYREDILQCMEAEANE